MSNLLEDQLQQSLMIQAAIIAMPDLPKMYPKILNMIEGLDKGIDDFLGDGEKMAVITKKQGVSLLIVLDTTKEFTLNNSVMLEGKENPVLHKFEKSEWKNKVLSSTALEILKEHYEKTIENIDKDKEAHY